MNLQKLTTYTMKQRKYLSSTTDRKKGGHIPNV